MAQEMAVEPEQAERSEEYVPRIVRGRVDSFALYEITDDELRILEEGSPSSLHLNFSIFCNTLAISFLIALLTSTVDTKTFTVFVVLTVVGFLVGGFLFILWFRARKSVAGVVRKIRARIPGLTSTTPGEQSEP